MPGSVKWVPEFSTWFEVSGTEEKKKDRKREKRERRRGSRATEC